METHMKILFNPQSVAIFGASNEQGKVGTLVMNNIISSKYMGKIIPINPNKKYEDKDIYGYKVYPSLEHVPEQVDLAVIVVPRKFVKATLEQSIKHRIKSAIIIPAGFGEVEDGRIEEKNLVEIAKRGNLKFVGPNCMGLWSANVFLNVNMSFLSPLPGNVSIISQSGSLSVVFCSELRRMGVGVRFIVSSGNEASLSFEDYLEYFIENDKTKVIVGFLEGLRKGDKFIEVCRKNKEKKPIIILKAGSTKAGKTAAFSHTASISGSNDIYDAIFKQYGIINVENINQLLDITRAFIYLNPPEGNKVAVMAGGGGMGVLTADACDRVGLNVNKPSQNLIDKMNKLLPSYWSRSNPIDTVGSQDFMVYAKLLELLLEANEYDIVITNVIEIRTILDQFYPQHEEVKKAKKMMMGIMASMEKSLARKEIKIWKKYQKPVIFMSHAYPNSEIFRIFEKKGALVVKNPDAAAFVLKKMLAYHTYHKFGKK
ncbi:MAG: CoA-binding protein [Candidatus Helarchaeota archaeon]|nr:CoA-binding protein [Candidatus Helarchaeota archaeon]